jgi:hypothetical protein
MTKHTDDRLVHHYDTQRHQVACGSHATDDHSTKHLRGVTCSDCITLMRDDATRARTESHETASSGTLG